MPNSFSLYERERSDHPELNLPAIHYPAIVQEFAAYGPVNLARANGLSEADNRELFTTGSIDFRALPADEGSVSFGVAPPVGIMTRAAAIGCGHLVGAAGFEPTTCSTQNCRATRLRYTPIIWKAMSIHA